MTASAPRSLSLGVTVLIVLLTAAFPWIAKADGPPAQAQFAESYGKLPLSFEENQGQTADEVKFLSRGAGYSLFLTPTEAVMALRKPKSPSASGKAQSLPPVRMNSHLHGFMAEARENPAAQHPKTQNPEEPQTAVLRMRLAGAREPSSIVGKDRQPGTANYLKGRDPGQWRTGVATYGKVEYQGVYPGVDLVYYGRQRQLEYDFIVAPGADPKQIRLNFAANGKDGEQAVTPRLDANGDLLLPTEGGEVRLHKPLVYQDVNGQRREIDGRFVLFPASSPPLTLEEGRGEGNLQVGFQVAEYDHDWPLVIDPVLVYSTYLGGGDNDLGQRIAVDSDGNSYVSGYTWFYDFPAVNAKYPYYAGKYYDAFVSKLSANGHTVLYSTYLGGNDYDWGLGIAVDGSGNAYVSGHTLSSDFPMVNARYPHFWGHSDAFVFKLSANGQTVLYSTYLGGGSDDACYGIAVDDSGNAYVSGYTYSSNFPTVNAKYPYSGGSSDAFVTKLSANGQAVLYSTYLGGSSMDNGINIAVDRRGNAYVIGETSSLDFPTVNSKYPHLRGSQDAFAFKLSSNGQTILYSTYLGGSSDDLGYGIAVDSSGNAYVSGSTYSSDFPTVNSRYPRLREGGYAFVSKLSADGQSVIYSSYLGGNGGDTGHGIAVDSGGNAYVTGETWSSNFPSAATDPTIKSYDPTYNGNGDAFVAKFSVGYSLHQPLANQSTSQMQGKARGECLVGGYCARSLSTQAHNGIDYAVAAGMPVYAICNGTVKVARTAATTPNIWNRFTIIDHSNCGGFPALFAYYGHIDAIVKVGQKVTAGQQIGIVGNWGSNSHLHLSLNSAYKTTGWGYVGIGESTAANCNKASVTRRRTLLASKGWLDPAIVGSASNWKPFLLKGGATTGNCNASAQKYIPAPMGKSLPYYPWRMP